MNSTLSRNQRRKLRLIEKGKALANTTGSVVAVSTTKARRRRRNRNRRRRSPRVTESRGSGSSTAIDYLYALQNPSEAAGAKIPDMIAYPTGTFQLVHHGTLQNGAGGDSVAIRCQPLVGDMSAVFPFIKYNGTTANAIGTAANGNWAARTSIAGLYGLFRPVSAELNVMYIGTEMNASGLAWAGCTYISTTNNALPTTVDAVANLPEMQMFPAKGGVHVLWKPLDNSHLQFYDVNGPDIVFNENHYPTLVFAATYEGTVTSALDLFEYEFIVNFEAVPSSDTANLVETEPSPYDPGALRRAFEWAAKTGNTATNFIEGASQAYEMGMNVAGNVNRLASVLGYQALPQRIFERRRRRSSRSEGGSMLSAMLQDAKERKRNILVIPTNESSDSENEDEGVMTLKEATKKFEALTVESPKSSPRLRKDFNRSDKSSS